MLVKHKGDVCLTVKCVVANCMYMTKTWTAHRQHCKCKYNLNMNRNTLAVLQHELNGNDDNTGDDVQNFSRHNNNTYFCDQMITAKSILSLEAAHKVSSTALDSVFNRNNDVRNVAELVNESFVYTVNRRVS